MDDGTESVKGFLPMIVIAAQGLSVYGNSLPGQWAVLRQPLADVFVWGVGASLQLDNRCRESESDPQRFQPTRPDGHESWSSRH
jgi:hypothetical protein